MSDPYFTVSPAAKCPSHGNPGQFSSIEGKGGGCSNRRISSLSLSLSLSLLLPNRPRCRWNLRRTNANSTEVVWDQGNVLPCIFIRRRRPAVKANCPSNLRLSSCLYMLTRRGQLACCSTHRYTGVSLCLSLETFSATPFLSCRFLKFSSSIPPPSCLKI